MGLYKAGNWDYGYEKQTVSDDFDDSIKQGKQEAEDILKKREMAEKNKEKKKRSKATKKAIEKK